MGKIDKSRIDKSKIDMKESNMDHDLKKSVHKRIYDKVGKSILNSSELQPVLNLQAIKSRAEKKQSPRQSERILKWPKAAGQKIILAAAALAVVFALPFLAWKTIDYLQYRQLLISSNKAYVSDLFETELFDLNFEFSTESSSFYSIEDTLFEFEL